MSAILTASSSGVSNASSRIIRSLALSVYFKNPDFGMKQYEVLSRATAFLLSVDPFYEAPASSSEEEGIYSHLGSSDRRRMERNFRRTYAAEPAGGPPGRTPQELGWLEFCPAQHRPVVHCVASSHVLAPWKWPQFYPQSWLRNVEQKHCAYSVEVLCSSNPEGKPLAKYALNPYPIHHPGGLDLAVIHLKEEETVLKQMENLGVEMLYLRDLEKEQPFLGEELQFEGFQVAAMDLAESNDFQNANNNDEDWDDEPHEERANDKGNEDNEDKRVFFPYTETGKLIFGSSDRFLVSTPKPLPQGLCGGPVLDVNNRVAGIVEGVVPLNHEDKRIAGSSAFIPSIQLRRFLDTYAERIMLEQIMPKFVFDRVARMKQGLPFREKDEVDTKSIFGSAATSKAEERLFQDTWDELMKNMKKYHTPEETKGIMDMVRRERDEVLKILDKEGGDVDEVIARVRAATRAKQKEELERLLKDEEKGDLQKRLSDEKDDSATKS